MQSNQQDLILCYLLYVWQPAYCMQRREPTCEMNDNLLQLELCRRISLDCHSHHYDLPSDTSISHIIISENIACRHKFYLRPNTLSFTDSLCSRARTSLPRYWSTNVGLLLAQGSNFPAATNDSYGTSGIWTPVCWTQARRLNHRATATPHKFYLLEKKKRYN